LAKRPEIAVRVPTPREMSPPPEVAELPLRVEAATVSVPKLEMPPPFPKALLPLRVEPVTVPTPEL